MSVSLPLFGALLIESIVTLTPLAIVKVFPPTSLSAAVYFLVILP
ncbi:hypothetical protein [Fusobacterium polymorphum]